jgi:hypothetical protein
MSLIFFSKFSGKSPLLWAQAAFKTRHSRYKHAGMTATQMTGAPEFNEKLRFLLANCHLLV